MASPVLPRISQWGRTLAMGSLVLACASQAACPSATESCSVQDDAPATGGALLQRLANLAGADREAVEHADARSQRALLHEYMLQDAGSELYLRTDGLPKGAEAFFNDKLCSKRWPGAVGPAEPHDSTSHQKPAETEPLQSRSSEEARHKSAHAQPRDHRQGQPAEPSRNVHPKQNGTHAKPLEASHPGPPAASEYHARKPGGEPATPLDKARPGTPRSSEDHSKNHHGTPAKPSEASRPGTSKFSEYHARKHGGTPAKPLDKSHPGASKSSEDHANNHNGTPAKPSEASRPGTSRFSEYHAKKHSGTPAKPLDKTNGGTSKSSEDHAKHPNGTPAKPSAISRPGTSGFSEYLARKPSGRPAKPFETSFLESSSKPDENLLEVGDDGRDYAFTRSFMDGWDPKDSPSMSATLDESGFQNVVALHSAQELKLYVRRVADSCNLKVIDEGGLNGAIGWFNGTEAKGTFEAIKLAFFKALLAASRDHWVEAKRVPGIDANSAPLDLLGYVQVRALRDASQMIMYLRRMVKNLGMRIVDQEGFSRFAKLYTEPDNSESFQKLMTDMKKAAFEHAWAELE